MRDRNKKAAEGTASKTASNSRHLSGNRAAVQRAYLRKENAHSIDSRWAEYSWRKSEWKHQKQNRRTIEKGSDKSSKSSDKSKVVRGGEVVRAAATGHAAALEKKENYQALLKQLEYEEKVGNLVELDAARTIFFEEFRAQRDSWMNWPVQEGPLIAAQLGLDADRVTAVLTEAVHRQLLRLSEPNPEFSDK
jgi:hypothetical protein